MRNQESIVHRQEEQRSLSKRRPDFLFILLLILAILALLAAAVILALDFARSMLDLPLSTYLPMELLPSGRQLLISIGVLILVAIFFGVLARVQIKRNKAYQFRSGCPNCHTHDLVRVHRLHYHRILAKTLRIPMRNYACRNCDWKGVLLYTHQPTPLPELAVDGGEKPDTTVDPAEVMVAEDKATTEQPEPATAPQEPSAVTSVEALADEELQESTSAPLAAVVTQEDPQDSSAAPPVTAIVDEEREESASTPLVAAVTQEDLQDSSAAPPEIPIADEEREETPKTLPMATVELVESQGSEQGAPIATEPVSEELEELPLSDDLQPVDAAGQLAEVTEDDSDASAAQELEDEFAEPAVSESKPEELAPGLIQLAAADEPDVEGDAASDSAALLEDESITRAIVIAPFGISLRGAPDVDAEIILSLEPDTIVEIIEVESGDSTVKWRKVSFEGQAGWVSAAFLKHLLT